METIPATIENASVSNNSGDGDTLVIDGMIGGVHQKIIVTEEWYCDKAQPGNSN